MEKEKVFLNKDELMERWHCSRGTINNRVKRNAIPYFKPTGKKIAIFPLDEIVKYEQTYTIGKEKKRGTKNSRKVLSVSNKEWRIE